MRRALLALALLALTAAAQAQPKMLDCARSADPTWCRAAQDQYRAERSSPRSYGTMRNVAYCLWTGCDGAFAIDRRESCRIRRQIMDLHKRERDRSDDSHFAACVQAGH